MISIGDLLSASPEAMAVLDPSGRVILRSAGLRRLDPELFEEGRFFAADLDRFCGGSGKASGPLDLLRGAEAQRVLEVRRGQADWRITLSRSEPQGALAQQTAQGPGLSEAPAGFLLAPSAPTAFGTLVRFEDVTLQRRQLARLDRAARTDPLTGLGNRRALAEALAGLRATGGALATLDIVEFRLANNRLGHGFGDGLLKRFAALLRDCAGVSGLTGYRIGGDEFALLWSGDAEPRCSACLERLAAAAAPMMRRVRPEAPGDAAVLRIAETVILPGQIRDLALLLEEADCKRPGVGHPAGRLDAASGCSAA
ncbi:GGDEF domain-containing protein [Pseudoroseicyclus aestuarii]|uniref:Diguanylate cyclase (GGDEF)-like protein n=1 Tax=Pseudoroseicyclus aestuarii TaxID=1795041 RepID=A0A318ST23_9RHOB|nr:GGDEF domain-containing protein [Pseudoroseicyclus aestuarii]PYE81277.1 diguanylate cyclase (GGDEF)-like protein [Pseudoroseicyclus aestuarii]